MTIKHFESKYAEKGGFKKLVEMRENLSTLKQVSFEFSVSIERVRQWMKELFGIAYDPRMERKRKRIEAAKRMIEQYGLEETKVLHKNKNRYYLKKAIKELYVSIR